MGNSNRKASVIVKHKEERQEKRQWTEGSSELQDHKNVELVDSEMKLRRRVRPNPNNRLQRNVPKAMEGEQVAAGWPAWLSTVAGEAINGWLPRRADTFEKLDKIGDGSYSIVYKARDLMHNRIVALKKVRYDNLEPESVRFMAREILILRRLDHPNVIKLEGLVTSRMSMSLYLIFEYMEHDLAGLLSIPDVEFTEAQVIKNCCPLNQRSNAYMHQLLCGLEHCHNRGILHRDIKSSNLLINNDGVLKIADFGLSTFFDPQRSFPLTSRVVTLWYRPLELLLGAINYGVEVDLWSTGCVLGELFAGKPIMPGRSEVEQLHKIYKLCGSPSEDFWRKHKLPHATIFKPQHPYRRCLRETFKYFPPAALGLLDTLLSIDPKSRGTASLALSSEFFTTEPYAYDPSSLPKYPAKKVPRDENIRPRAPLRVFKLDANTELAGSEKQINKNHFPNPAFDPSNNISLMLEERDRQIQEIAQQARLRKGRGGEVPSENVTQMLEEHDRKIQGAGRQARNRKLRVDQVQSQRMQANANPGDSNPSVVPSIDVDRMLEEHDRHIQEATERARVEKRKVVKVQAHKDRPTVNKTSPRPSQAPSSNVDEILEEHDRLIQESVRQAMLEKRRGSSIRIKDANSK